MYSVVIPAHNESKNLAKLLDKAYKTLKNTNEKFEIIVVNDNSTDNSKKTLENLKKRIKQLKVITRTTDPGVGYAIREGLSNVKGEVTITMDGDLSHDPAEIPKLLKFLKDFDMVCGSRYAKGGSADMALSRIIVSGLFNLIFRNLVGIPIKDFTSGFRVCKTRVIKNIKLNSKTFGIYIEISLKAYLAGFKLTEIPITYHKRVFGKSNLNYFRQGPEYLKVAFEALKIKLLK
ncbi:MAG: glycosyltransferase [Nanoarchaeota archaeon]